MTDYRWHIVTRAGKFLEPIGDDAGSLAPVPEGTFDVWYGPNRMVKGIHFYGKREGALRCLQKVLEAERAAAEFFKYGGY